MLFLLLAFEFVYCENKKSIFENPTEIFNKGIKALWVQNFGFLPYNRITYVNKKIGIGISNFGNQLYRENEFILSYGINYNEVKLGGSIRPMLLFIKEKENKFTLGIDLGISFKINENIETAIATHNINLPKLGEETIPIRILSELLINFNENFVSNIQIYKEGEYSSEIRLINEIKITEVISIITGIRNYTPSFSLGIALNKEKFLISYITRTHTIGLTHIVGINFLQK